MKNGIRIPITNVLMGGDYTGCIYVGQAKKPLNVLLDTGSSALAVDSQKYQPDTQAGDQLTDLVQTDTYGDGSSWTGAVIKTSVIAGGGGASILLEDANLAVAYQKSANMFPGIDGILGLAYSPLDLAYRMQGPSWPGHFTSAEAVCAAPLTIEPYLTQLSKRGVAADKFAFYTQRSYTKVGARGTDEAENRGWLIIGGGEEATELYRGAFQTAKVLADKWYNTNLKSIRVGNNEPMIVRDRPTLGAASNSIVDSGTNSLNLGPLLIGAIVTQLTPSQQALFSRSVYDGAPVAVSELKLDTWPVLEFVLQGDSADVVLSVPPNNYWQVDSPSAGSALAAISEGQDGFSILGLPLLNGYFTIFDGEADAGRGAIRFASRAQVAIANVLGASSAQHCSQPRNSLL